MSPFSGASLARSLSPDTHPRHHRLRPSPNPPLLPLPPDPPASLASPTLEFFPPVGPSRQPPTLPSLGVPASDPAFVSRRYRVPGTGCPFRSAVSSPDLQNPMLDSSSAPNPRLSSRCQGSPKGELPGFKRLYSDVVTAPPQPPAAKSSDFIAVQPPSRFSGAVAKDIRILQSGRLLDLSTQNLSASAQGTGDIQVGENPWKEVKGKRRWRNHSAFTTPNNLEQMHSRKARFLQHMEGKCFRCLSTKHKIVDCREPFRCWRCLKFGHLASSCSKKFAYKSTLPPLKTHTEAFPALAPLCFPPRSFPSPPKSPIMDDLTACPLLDSVVISATGEIERNRERFSAHSLVAWQVGAQEGRVELNTFADDVPSAFNIRRADIQFTKFHPEDFFITCSNQGDRDAILRQPRLATASGRVYVFRPWDESLHGVEARFRYRARVCIEGIPMHV